MNGFEVHGNIIVIERQIKLDICGCFPDKPRHIRVCDDNHYWYECIRCLDVVSKKFKK